MTRPKMEKLFGKSAENEMVTNIYHTNGGMSTIETCCFLAVKKLWEIVPSRFCSRAKGVRKQLTSLLSRFLAPDDHPRVSTWLRAGKTLNFSAVSHLQDQLSAACDEVFSKSPHILNELINRRQLSSAAAKARRNLIERMFSHRSEPDLGLEKRFTQRGFLTVHHRA